MTYCYRCPECGYTRTTNDRETQSHPHGETEPTVLLVRDYRAEAVGIGSGVRVSRSGTDRDAAELFLPTNKDFAKPGDPDGTKGVREWRETHSPKTEAKRPYWPGSVERKSF